MISYFSEVMDRPSLINTYNGRFDLLVPKDFYSKKTPKKYREDIQRIRKFYFGDEVISKQTLERYATVSFEQLVPNSMSEKLETSCASC
jgi:hypothetical protein